MRRAPTCGSCRSHGRRCCALSAKPRHARRGRLELRRAASPAIDGLPVHGGTEVVPLLRAGLLQADSLVDIRGVVPRDVEPGRIGGGATLAQLECDPGIPDVLREACRLAASPQLRNMGSLAGNLLQSTRCWYWRLNWPCRLHGGGEGVAHKGEPAGGGRFCHGLFAPPPPPPPPRA